MLKRKLHGGGGADVAPSSADETGPSNASGGEMPSLPSAEPEAGQQDGASQMQVSVLEAPAALEAAGSEAFGAGAPTSEAFGPGARAAAAPPSADLAAEESEAAGPSSPTHVTDHQRRVAARGAAWTSLDKLGYYWEQTEQEVRIYLSLSAVSSENLRCSFSHRSCELQAECGQQRYFFELKRTFAPIDPALSLAKVPRSKRHVALKLRKREPGVEWPYLRCGDNDVVLV